MKVWQENEEGKVVLLKDSEDLEIRFVDDVDDIGKKNIEQKPDTRWIKDLIEDEWPDSTILWNRSCSKSSALCQSPDAEEWQCGSFGPKGRVCKRLVDHRGSCSDLFLPEDRNNVTQRLKRLKVEELDEILGKKPRNIASRKFDIKKLREILKQEGR
jgi:hypothetical protein